MPSRQDPPRLTELLDRYALVLLDVYGVLITGAGPCPGAAALLDALHRLGKPYLLLTNDASRLPWEVAARLRSFGLEMAPQAIVTSGSLLAEHFARQGLEGSRCVVLGTAASEDYVRQAGGRPVAVSDQEDCDVLAICDDAGFPFLETVNGALTMVFNTLDRGRTPHLVLPNPDLIFPRTRGGFGITAGAIAVMIERAIEVRYPQRPPLRCVALGKPHPPMFQRALAIGGTRNMLMIGDQLATDILGAQRFGIDSLLVSQGVTSPAALAGALDIRPTYALASLE